MTITEVAALKDRMEKEARKWNGYLGTIESKGERDKELARLLMETWLSGHLWTPEKGPPR